ncbi:hypothetical protein ACOIDY_32035, partial [Klebsiella pneumoniae]|uniref:hypothetical protein n=2 Tax=Klebsiella pneumoniae TaxID=573 RepID=UPI0030198E58
RLVNALHPRNAPFPTETSEVQFTKAYVNVVTSAFSAKASASIFVSDPQLAKAYEKVVTFAQSAKDGSAVRLLHP